jgi:NADH-quinone oxidoreductase subunit G
MPKLTVNGNEVEFEQGMTVLQACEVAGEEVPRFCYHERLKIAGNCRMCLVQIEGGPPKPAASCAMPAGDGMVVHTDTPMVKKAREGVMEFTLINHPLDCPICDQGGECDLQDFAMIYGKGESRYKEPKRAIKDKSYGPLVKPTMTRCIHCTRCIRFMTDIAGCDDLGGTGRGENMEVGTFIESNINNELSGNIIDLCPVGALTSKPYEFKCRSWELKHTDSIDVLDAVGCNIRVDSKGNEVMRILPRLNEDINEEWISDKTRFAYDGLKTQRLDKPYIRNNKKLEAVSWDDALEATVKKLKAKPEETAIIIGDQVDAETMLLVKQLAEKLEIVNIDCRQDGQKIEGGDRSARFNSTIAGIEEADVCLLIGTNPRYEASLVNARLRKRSLEGSFKVASIGDAAIDLTFPCENLGDSADILDELLAGKSAFAKELKGAKSPLIIIGDGALTRADGDVILAKAKELADKVGAISDAWNGFSVLHTAASRVAGLELSVTPTGKFADVDAILKAAADGVIKTLFLVGADELDFAKTGKAKIVYLGTHGDKAANKADIILAGSAYTEKEGTYLNTEGRVQRTRKSIFAPGDAREDWAIINDLLRFANACTTYEDIFQVRAALNDASDAFAHIDAIAPLTWKKTTTKGKMLKAKLVQTVDNFYMTDPITRASKIMAQCADEFVLNDKNKKKAA